MSGAPAAARSGAARRCRTAPCIALAALILTAAAASAATADAWSQPFAGAWSGQGRFMGNEAHYQFDVAPALDGHFVRFTVRYRWQADGQDAAFTGEALYPATASAPWRGAWFDSEGHYYSTSAYLQDPHTLVVHWGDVALRGRSEYRLSPAGELHVSDSVHRDGQWQTFSNARLKRAPAGG